MEDNKNQDLKDPKDNQSSKSKNNPDPRLIDREERGLKPDKKLKDWIDFNEEKNKNK